MEREVLDIRITTSHTEAYFPILGALRAAKEFLEDKDLVGWQPANILQIGEDRQRMFCEKIIQHIVEAGELGDDLRWKSDVSAHVINSWLANNGFDIKLDQGPPGSFCTASILDVLVRWLKKATKDSITSRNDGKSYPAVKMDGSEIEVWNRTRTHQWPIVKIPTHSGDFVFMTIAEPEFTRFSDLVGTISGIGLSGQIPDGKCDNLFFPMVEYDRQVDISWIEGLTTGKYYIHQALQQTQFRMNEVGARARSAAAMQFFCLCIEEKSPDIVIDRPFLLWIERPGLGLPLFAGVFAENTWKEPSEL